MVVVVVVNNLRSSSVVCLAYLAYIMSSSRREQPGAGEVYIEETIYPVCEVLLLRILF